MIQTQVVDICHNLNTGAYMDDVTGTGISEGGCGNGNLNRGRRGCGGAMAKLGLDLLSEHLKFEVLYIEDPFEVPTHLPLHLVDLTDQEHSLSNDTPGLVRVSIVTDNLRYNHEHGDK